MNKILSCIYYNYLSKKVLKNFRGKDLAFLPVIVIPVIPFLPIRQTGVVQCEPLVSNNWSVSLP